MEQMARVLVRVRDASGAPLAGAAYRVRLYDQDALYDDFLAERRPDADGCVEFVFDLARAQSLDSPRETRPDLYVTVVRDGDELARSRVERDVDFTDGRTVDLGELRLK